MKNESAQTSASSLETARHLSLNPLLLDFAGHSIDRVDHISGVFALCTTTTGCQSKCLLVALMDTTRSQPYQYTRLQSELQFRYLVLQPGTRGDTLECSLVESSLHDTTSTYEAISYVWGSSVRDREILCDGKALNITTNLFEVLQTFRLPDKPRSLWADSICINQNDVIERAEQVAIMGKIFSTADQVLVHVGRDDNGQAELAKSLIEDVGTMVEEVIQTLGDPIPWNSFPNGKAEDPLVTDPRWYAMQTLFQQPWFRRGWVIPSARLMRSY